MPNVRDIAAFLEAFAPSALAESWDNVGLLVGDGRQRVERVMTCLTITPASAREAIAAQADLIVSHHPLPFRPLKRLTAETTEGRLVWELASERISVYSPHTAFDSAAQGINQRLAEGLNLDEIVPLVPGVEIGQGAGRQGVLWPALTLAELSAHVKKLLKIEHLQVVGPTDRVIERVAVACGSAAEFMAQAKESGCGCLVTGEARFHACLEAEAIDVSLILAGHFASERFAVEELAEILGKTFGSLEVWASRDERDPIGWL